MYICDCCGRLREQPRLIKERHGSPYGYELYFESCSCGGEYDAAVPCDICGTYIREQDIHNTEEGALCRECYETGEEYAQERDFLALLAV